MATAKQKAAARRNIKKAAKAARRKKTITRLPKKTRTALGKQAAKVAKRKRRSGRKTLFREQAPVSVRKCRVSRCRPTHGGDDGEDRENR
jgi:hypothetical protein